MSWDNQQLSGKRRIFNLLRREVTLSRAALAQRCGLTRPAVSAIIDELLADGLIVEVGRGSSTGGKPPILLELNALGFLAIGLDLGDDYLIRGVLSDVSGHILTHAEIAYENNFDGIVAGSVQLIEQLRDTAPANALRGIGLAVSGVVDPERNEVVGAATTDIVRRGLATEIARQCALPVVMERRPNAAAVAEWFFGAGKAFDTLVYLTSGRGVGAGLVINGEVYRGRTGAAGEVGGLIMPEGGMLEELTRPSAMAAELSVRKGQKLNFQELLELYHAGDADAEALTRANASRMAYAAAAAVNFFDPEAIVLGGRAVEFGAGYFEFFRTEFERFSAVKFSTREVKVVSSQFGTLGVAAGGAQVVLDRLVR